MSDNIPYYVNFPEPTPEIPITIYYKSNCEPCDNALKILRDFRFKDNSPLLFMAIDAAEMGKILQKKDNYIHDGRILFDEEIKNIIKKNKIKIPSSTLTLPIIFKGTGKSVEYIGGYLELKELITNQQNILHMS